MGCFSVLVWCVSALVILKRAYLVHLSVRVSFIFPFPDTTSGLMSSSKSHQGLFLFEGKMMRMKKKEVAKSSKALPKMRPALTPEARERQMISLAMDVVEERLRNGTATSQETTHFLKLATEKYKYETKVLEKQAELVTAKTEQVRSSAKSEELYKEAIQALRRYGGHASDVED